MFKFICEFKEVIFSDLKIMLCIWVIKLDSLVLPEGDIWANVRDAYMNNPMILWNQFNVPIIYVLICC